MKGGGRKAEENTKRVDPTKELVMASVFGLWISRETRVEWRV